MRVVGHILRKTTQVSIQLSRPEATGTEGSGGKRRRAGGGRTCARAAGSAGSNACGTVAASAAARAVVAAPVAVWLIAFRDVVEAQAAMHAAMSRRQRRGQWSLRRWRRDLQRCSGGVTRCAGGRASSWGGSHHVGIGGASGSGGAYRISVLVRLSGVEHCAFLHLGASRGSNARLSMRSVGRNLRKTAQVNIQLDSEGGW